MSRWKGKKRPDLAEDREGERVRIDMDVLLRSVK